MPQLYEPRGQQLAGRFKLLHNDPLPYGTGAQRGVWEDLLRTMENALRLRNHRPQTLPAQAAYLHRRTAGVLGSLSHLLREAAVTSVLDGSERITRDVLESIELDIRAEQQALTPQTTVPRRAGRRR